MRFGVPDWLGYEVRHKAERLRDRWGQLQVRDSINDNSRIVVITTLVSILVLVLALALARRETPARRYPVGKKAWFYDLNTGELFTASSRRAGPIEAPSGPQPTGEPAGFRAHVYSYVPDPKKSELFVGFLEAPDPKAEARKLTSDLGNFPEWAQGRLIRRVGDEAWVSPTSQPGRQIIRELMRPNERGQTLTYHTAR